MLNYNEKRQIVVSLLNCMDEGNMRFERALFNHLDAIVTKKVFKENRHGEDMTKKMHDVFDFIFKK